MCEIKTHKVFGVKTRTKTQAKKRNSKRLAHVGAGLLLFVTYLFLQGKKYIRKMILIQK